jgi:hypothetical protein
VEHRAGDIDVRTAVIHLIDDVRDLRTDIRRLDDRIFQLMLLQLGTLATALVSVALALVR